MARRVGSARAANFKLRGSALIVYFTCW